MNFTQRRAVSDCLNKYCHLSKPHDHVEVCEWTNGEGWDIALGNKLFTLTHGELQAIFVLCNTPHPES